MEDMYDKYRSTNGCGTALAGGIVTILIVIGVISFLLFGLSGCASQKCVPELIETHDTIVRVDSFISERVRDSIVYKEREDSIYERVRDSISVRQKGDTVWVEKYHESEKFKGSSKTTNETTNKATAEKSKSSDKEKTSSNEVKVKTERYIPKFYLCVTWCSIAWLIVRLVWCILGWIPQTRMWRDTAQRVIDRIVKALRLR